MGKLDQYCFDGTNSLSLKKLPTDSKKDQVDKEKILAKTAPFGNCLIHDYLFYFNTKQSCHKLFFHRNGQYIAFLAP